MPDRSREAQARPPSVHVALGDASFGNQIQVGRTDSRQEQVVHLVENPQVRVYLLRYREVLDQLEAEKREAALSSLATAEAEMNSQRPNQGRLHEALVSLRSIAEGVAGNAAFTGLVELGRHLF